MINFVILLNIRSFGELWGVISISGQMVDHIDMPAPKKSRYVVIYKNIVGIAFETANVIYHLFLSKTGITICQCII